MSSSSSEISVNHPDRVRILRDDEDCPNLPIVKFSGKAWAVVWPGVEAELRSIHHISLGSLGLTVELNHPMEAVYYLMEGAAAAVDLDSDSKHELVTGSMIHIDPDTSYLFEAGSDGAEIIGGPCPADHRMYAHLEPKWQVSETTVRK